ncbi:hypothetical protein Nepgr_014530 [Nepenthes gracilis]|uniref:BHLH domain-containing protein n=1 Tax=Nepenthes gracilis TaxID=150966 RepID=A0AAD3XQ79_NEPGR|nr:hypothetical protein Nepgr_014530 [Nepenthes gracilis]
MGYMLKEALKSLCGVNQWSYAVFWKIGCQNPKLLIWEECHYQPMPCSVLPGNFMIGNQGLTWEALEGCRVSPHACDSQIEAQVGGRIHLLINKMMMANQVHVLGEGLVGRAAFSGNHQWIVSENYNKDALPPEVLNEVHLQFSANMQTVAVIPVIPYGVVQFGSTLDIIENIGFVHEVKRLILQLGCVHSALLSDNCIMKESVGDIGLRVADSVSVSADPYGDLNKICSGSFIANGLNMQRNLIHSSGLATHSASAPLSHIQEELQPTASTFQISNLTQTFKSHGDQCQMDANLPDKCLLEKDVIAPEVIPSSPDVFLDQHTSSYNPGCIYNHYQSAGSYRSFMEEPVVFNAGSQEGTSQNLGAVGSFITSQLIRNKGRFLGASHGCANLLCGKSKLDENLNNQLGISSYKSADSNVPLKQMSGAGFHGVDFSTKEVASLSDEVEQSTAGIMLSGSFSSNGHYSEDRRLKAEYVPEKGEGNNLYEIVSMASSLTTKHMSSSKSIPGPCNDSHNGNRLATSKDLFEDVYVQLSSGDDLFDILGMDFKNKLSNTVDNNCNVLGSNVNNQIRNLSRSMNFQELGSDFHSDCERISESTMYSECCSDQLLGAVVSGVHSSLKQTSNDDASCRTTSTKISSSCAPNNSLTNSQMQEQLLGFSNPAVKLGERGTACIQSACEKTDDGNCSQTSSIYGSQISSWIEQVPIVNRDTSISSANSRKPDEAGNSNRKRHKPGENPRPRPKDRQMIQDRMKELREIVPNGAKCSIDALLERTIKHMLFLQSVTKHADKLKRMVESKIINEDGGLLLKDNFGGGTTWAFEVGCQSMVCPIVVEDLNPPRQLLVEMLCEERGFFLEIADIIRGLGLTILKGVMETRNDKIWARFAVEANRDVTRMEIFLPLVHLLEQTVKSSGPSAARGTHYMAAEPSFHPASSVHAKQQPVAPVVCSQPPAI